MLYIFIGCLAFGLIYAVLALVLGKYESGSPSFLNPLIIASATTTFGAVGLAAMKCFEANWLTSTIAALLLAGMAGLLIYIGIVKKRI